MPRRALKWVGMLVLALVLLIVAAIALFDWNSLRGLLERKVEDKTGRQLTIKGDLRVQLGWPLAHIEAGQVAFANPAWASAKQMLVADEVGFSLDLPKLLLFSVFIPEVELKRPVLVLERSDDGRENWRLDRQQQVDSPNFRIGVLRLDQGRLMFEDHRQETSIQADISTAKRGQSPARTGAADAGIVFDAWGQFKGFPFLARGNGGPALALGTDSAPYPLKLEAAIGRTRIAADGTVTGLLGLAAIDMHVALKGDSLAQLFPQLGLALPETHPYDLAGQLGHKGNIWRYEKFAGRVGKSDLAGTLQLDTGGTRAFLQGDLVSRRLHFADLGPVIGARPGGQTPGAPPSAGKTRQRAGKAEAAKAARAAAPGRVLPREPYNAEHWRSLDAQVKFSTEQIDRAQELPLENLVTVIKLRDSVMTLDPLDFGVAGGHLDGTVTLDGRQDPIQAVAKMRARKILLGKVLPTVKQASLSVGQMDGEVDLAGTGNAVGDMLARSNGKATFAVGEGKVSKLLMEQLGLHVHGILSLKAGGDKLVAVHCGSADFSVKKGVMVVDTLVLDTEVNNISGVGTIDLAQEKLDLTLVPRTKHTSLVSLHAPIHVRGTLGHPEVGIDTARVAARGLGAIVLGIVNPALTLAPLVEAGRDGDSHCGKLDKDATQPSPNKARRRPG